MRRGFVSLFFDRRCSLDYFFRNVNKMAAWIPDNKKKIKETMFIVNNRQLLLDMTTVIIYYTVKQSPMTTGITYHTVKVTHDYSYYLPYI
jgi:hypothetical protein